MVGPVARHRRRHARRHARPALRPGAPVRTQRHAGRHRRLRPQQRRPDAARHRASGAGGHRRGRRDRLCARRHRAPTQPDREAIDLLRRSKKPVVYVANKVDTREREAASAELYELGVPELIPVSALHGRGTGRPRRGRGAAPTRGRGRGRSRRTRCRGSRCSGAPTRESRLSSTGWRAPSARWSTSKPGTTRDPVDSRISFGGREFVMVDTAGVRRRARVEQGSSWSACCGPSARSSARTWWCSCVTRLEGAAEQDRACSARHRSTPQPS